MGKLSKELKMCIHNRFDIEVVDVETGEVKQRAQAFNVVCDGYFAHLGTNVSSIIYGSGSGTPSASDSALFYYEGTASDNSAYSPSDSIDNSHETDGVWVRTIKRVIPNTQSVGVSISEVGFGQNSSGWLLTHAMLQDMNGNPITIQHTNTDIINVYCSLYLHYDGQAGDIHLYGLGASMYFNNNYYGGFVEFALYGTIFRGQSSSAKTVNVGVGVVSRMLNGRLWKGGSTTAGGESSATSNVYDSSTRTLKVVFGQVPVGTGNINGIKNLGFVNSAIGTSTNYALCSVVVEAGKTTIPPSRIQNESVGVGDGSTTRFRTKFHYPYAATVYINGVAQSSGVSILKRPAVGWTANQGINPNSSDYLGRTVYKDDKNILAPAAFTGNGDPAYTVYVPVIPSNGNLYELYCPDIGVSGTGMTGIYGSDDGENWNSISTGTSGSYSYRYYKHVGDDFYGSASLYMKAYDGYNIIFDNPPANGDVITIDYTTDYIPKDADHVLDVELTFTFGEYNE